MREGDAEAAVLITPLQGALAALPPHGVRLDAVDRSQAHFIKLSLLRHALYRKSQCVPIVDTCDAEVKPRAVVPDICIGQPVAIHKAREMFRVAIRLNTAR